MNVLETRARRAAAAEREHGLTFEPPPRATLGCIQLPTDLTLDAEGPALVGRLPDVRLRLNKLELDGESLDPATYATGRDRLRRAAATLRPAGSLDAVGLACTSLAFTLGREHVQAELHAAHPRAAVTDMATAVLAALEQLGARRVALLTPYLDPLHELNLELLGEAGLEVVADTNLGLRTDAEITALSQDCLSRLVEAADHAEADTFLLGCSAFRACTPGFVDELEAKLHKPVVASQQAFLWHLLRLARIEDTLGGYGALLSGRTIEPTPRAKWVATPEALDGDGEDVYPTRVAEPGLVPRVDPVLDPERRYAGPLTSAQLEAFSRRGAIVLPQVFTPQEVAHLKQACDDLRGQYESRSYEELDQHTDMRVITERGGALVTGASEERPTLKSIWQIHLPAEHAPHMLDAADLSRRTICDSRLVDAARQILGEEVYVHQSRINFQPGWTRHNRGGSGFLWHQDFEQWHAEDGLPRMRAVSMAVLLEPAVPANGALMVMPGSHRRLVQAFAEEAVAGRYREGALSSGPVLPDTLLHELADRHGIEYCRGRAGDVVLFDCNTVHGSHTNISPWGRCMFFAVYNAVSNLPRAPFAGGEPRPEHLGSRDPRFAGVPLPSLKQDLSATDRGAG